MHVSHYIHYSRGPKCIHFPHIVHGGGGRFHHNHHGHVPPNLNFVDFVYDDGSGGREFHFHDPRTDRSIKSTIQLIIIGMRFIIIIGMHLNAHIFSEFEFTKEY